MKTVLIILIITIFSWISYDFIRKKELYLSELEKNDGFEKNDKWYYYRLKIKLFGIFIFIGLIFIIVWMIGKFV